MMYRFSFHDLLHVCLDLPKDGLMKDLDLPFRCYETSREDGSCDLKLIVEPAPFSVSPGPLMAVDHRFYVGPDYFYCSDTGGGGRWQAAVQRQGACVVVRFYGTAGGKDRYFYPHLLPQNLILLPLMEILLAQKNTLLLHAAAVGKDDRCFLLVGRGSAGKTSLVMNLLRKGYRLLGDERVMVGIDGEALSFLMHNGTLQYKLDHLPGERFRDKERTVWGAAAKYLGYLWQAYRDSSDITFHTLAKAKLRAIFFLNPQLGGDISLRPESYERARPRILLNNKAEWQKGYTFAVNNHGHYFSRYADILSFIDPQSDIAAHWQVMEKKIGRLLTDKIPLWDLAYPKSSLADAANGVDKITGLILEAVQNREAV